MSALIIDADGELWYTRQEELGVDYIKMPFSYGGKEYDYDLGKQTDFRAFYDAVRKGEVPKTMALNPDDYERILESYFKKGEDVLYISFSHAMSGTFDHLNTALRTLNKHYPNRKCRVFDTKAISLGAGIQMEYAAELKNKGASDDEIIKALKELRDRVSVYFVVENLMHLKRGGRLSGAAAFAGTLLSLKPVLTHDENGGLKVFEKITGKKKALRKMADRVIEELTGTEFPVYIVDADCPDEGDALRDMILEKRPEARIIRQIVGPVIGAHCGPGTVGVIFVADKRPVPLAK